jgi:hypothetical protein
VGVGEFHLEGVGSNIVARRGVGDAVGQCRGAAMGAGAEDLGQADRIAVRFAGVGKKVEWDVEAMRCTNIPEVNKFVRREYRKGWEV